MSNRRRVRTSIWITILSLGMPHAHACLANELSEKAWNNGADDCDNNQDPAIEVFQFDAATYILRQNKCVSFEAPFIYVLFGNHTVFVQDTGATADPALFPLYETVRQLVAKWEQAGGRKMRMLVTHSHSHGDHTAADAQFRNKPGTLLIEPEAHAVSGHFGFTDWPRGRAEIDLGERKLLVIPVPGHQEESVAVYDTRTQWLLTGDTVYPGVVYVKDWDAYRASIRRLATFAQANRVSAVMGSHIEMTRTPGKAYPIGSTFQPDEAPLPLTVQDLLQLNEQLVRAGATPKTITMPSMIVSPIGVIQRVLGEILKRMGFR